MPPKGHVQKAKLRPFRSMKDKKWYWRLVKNGHVVATDGSQGYTRRADCLNMARKIFGLDGHTPLDVEIEL